MDRSSFFKFFPVPEYLQFPAVGFDVSDGSVKFIELVRNGDEVVVGNYDKKSYNGDMVSALSSIQKQYGFDRVSVSIPEEEAFFVRIRLPFIKPEEIRGAIELQLEGYIPYPASEVEFDYEVLKTDLRPDGYVDVNVSVLPKKIIKNYLDIFQRSNLQPVSIMIEAEATSRAVVSMGSKEVVMVVNIGRVNTILSVVTNGSVWVSYTFKFGGDILVKRLQEICKFSTEDAEMAKNEKGLINSPGNEDVFGCLLPMVSSVRDEIRRHRHYWSEHRKEFLTGEGMGEIDKIIICGSQSVIPGLSSYLSVALSLETALADPWVNLFDFDKYIPPIIHRDSLDYATAIGLALNSLK
ncbi:MAG: pilus assembly protein PilM [bacterium]|nr:pilus assembly protein PilM [bacterium]